MCVFYILIKPSERNVFLPNTIEEVIESIKKNRLCIKGPLASITSGNINAPMNTRIRQSLDTYFATMHFKSISNNIPSKWPNLDVILARESTEGEYSNVEHQVTEGVVEHMKVVTRNKSERFARRAFELAIKLNRKTITIIHKANIM